MRIGSETNFHLSTVWNTKFFILCDVISLVRLQGKFEVDSLLGVKGWCPVYQLVWAEHYLMRALGLLGTEAFPGLHLHLWKFKEREKIRDIRAVYTRENKQKYVTLGRFIRGKISKNTWHFTSLSTVVSFFLFPRVSLKDRVYFQVQARLVRNTN